MNSVMLTFDLDWCPDFAIDFVAERLLERRIRATWFVTHVSPAVERLRQQPDLFELGIHPNFRPESTHGQSFEEVFDHCFSLVPNAVSMRTHSLYQSSPLLEYVLSKTRVETDVSIFLPRVPSIRPFEYGAFGRSITRIPYYWEDSYEMRLDRPSWHLGGDVAATVGLKVFDFHPIHIFLNSPDERSYADLVRLVPRLESLPLEVARAHVWPGEGTRTTYEELVSYLATVGDSGCIRGHRLGA